MRAGEYLEARGIELVELEDTSVGRLSIEAEFRIDGERGVVVAPRRGTLSDRYIALLAEEGVSFVVAELGAGLLFYGRAEGKDGLVSHRALEPMATKSFPAAVVFDYMTFLLKRCIERQEDRTKRHALTVAVMSNILLARLADEKAGIQDEWACFVDGSVKDCKALLARVSGGLKFSDIDMEAFLSLCAMISGFRLTPANPEELALFVDSYARIHDEKEVYYGLPLAMAPVFRAIGEKADSVLVITTAIGSQFSALSNHKNEFVVLDEGSRQFLPLLQRLFPAVNIVADKYLESSIKRQADTIVLIPPLSATAALKPNMSFASAFLDDRFTTREQPAEYLYILKAIEQCRDNGIIIAVLYEGALSGMRQKVYRDYLLETVQILGVISLPASFSFSGTFVRCSLLLMKKTVALSADYPISMIELAAEDFKDDAIAATVELVEAILKAGGRP